MVPVRLVGTPPSMLHAMKRVLQMTLRNSALINWNLIRSRLMENVIRVQLANILHTHDLTNPLDMVSCEADLVLLAVLTS